MLPLHPLTPAQQARAALKSEPERVSSLHKPDIEATIAAAGDEAALDAIDADLEAAGWDAAGNMRQSIAERLKEFRGAPSRTR